MFDHSELVLLRGNNTSGDILGKTHIRYFTEYWLWEIRLIMNLKIDLDNQKFDYFLIDQGYQPMPAIIYQDNQSSIALIKKGSPGSMRSRHIGIRYFWLHEQCEREIVEIVYLSTKLMGAANILTKPVVGSQSIVERDELTNWDKMYAMGTR